MFGECLLGKKEGWWTQPSLDLGLNNPGRCFFLTNEFD
jgi:hypothetical protein